jgi:tagaturonate reductase
VVVQSTGSERARAFNAAHGRYHVAVRGLDGGRTVDRVVEVHSVARALAAGTQWSEVLDAARSEDLRVVVSNATEAGYTLLSGDRLDSVPPASFPAKLLAVLAARFEAGLPGVTVLPCELIEQNADRLRDLVLEQAVRWLLPEPLLAWLRHDCAWRNTLVDRIVAAPKPEDPWAAADPLFAVAEPFALWLVEGALPVPCFADHPSVRQVDGLEPFVLRKVRILNGAHTALVAKALPQGCRTVRDAVLDPQIGMWLRRLLFDEIVPVLEGRTDAPGRFAEQVLERFANPFLDHRLADIALHHEVKVQTRLLPTHADYCRRFGRAPPLLDALLAGRG